MGERCENASISIFLASQMSQEVALLNGRGPKHGSQLCQNLFGVSNLRFFIQEWVLTFFLPGGSFFCFDNLIDYQILSRKKMTPADALP